MAWGDGDHAVGFDEVVAAFAVLFATESVDEAEGGAESAGADGESGAIGLPGVGFRGVRDCFVFLDHFTVHRGGREISATRLVKVRSGERGVNPIRMVQWCKRCAAELHA